MITVKHYQLTLARPVRYLARHFLHGALSLKPSVGWRDLKRNCCAWQVKVFAIQLTLQHLQPPASHQAVATGESPSVAFCTAGLGSHAHLERTPRQRSASASAAQRDK